MPFDWLELISLGLGWTYTILWSLSFYPQLYINYRRKSVAGLSIDFITLNPIGFSFFVVYALALKFSLEVRKEYQERHSGHYPTVQWNDLAFSIHALTMSLVVATQAMVYHRTPSQTFSTFNKFVIGAIGLILLVGGVKANAEHKYLDFIYLFSSIKIYLSISKYIPQVYVNYKNQSTLGWSIENIFLDLSGGILSLTQLIFDSYRQNDWSGIIGNPLKLGLSLVTLFFDFGFLYQHFILYKDSSASIFSKNLLVEPLEILPTTRNELEQLPLLSETNALNEDR